MTQYCMSKIILSQTSMNFLKFQTYKSLDGEYKIQKSSKDESMYFVFKLEKEGLEIKMDITCN
jgi:hypothetical protein